MVAFSSYFLMGFIFISLELSSLTYIKGRDFLGDSNGAKNQCLSTEIVVLIIGSTVQTVALVPDRVLA